MASKKYTLEELENKANDIRKNIIKMLETAGSGHSAGPLGLADIFTSLYFDVLKHDPKTQSGMKEIIYYLAMAIVLLFYMQR